MLWFSRLQAAEGPVHIGVYLPMTGDKLAYGQMEWDGIRAAHDMAGQVLGREVKLFLEDTKSDRMEATGAVKRLIKMHRVAGIIGEAVSATTLACSPIAEQGRVPMVSPSATSPLVTQGKKYIFRVCFTDPLQGQMAAKLAMEVMKAQTAAVIVDIAQDVYSVGLANSFVKSFLEMGGKVLSTSYIQSGDKDFSGQLSEVVSVKPDVIFVPNYYLESALLARQARDLGIKVPILMSAAAQTPQLIEIGGQAVEEVFLTGHFHVEAVSTELGRNFVSYYQKKYNREAEGFGALGADAYFLLIDAINRAGTTEGSKVREALAATRNFQGASGILSISEDGNAQARVVVIKVKKGKFTYVTTMGG